MTFVSVLLIWVGIKTIKDNYSRDINQIERLKGSIEKTETILKIKEGITLPYTSPDLKLKLLKIKINNSTERLYTYKASQDYYDLIKELKKGIKVTVYYKKIRESEVVNNIFRLESGQDIILAHEDYKEKEYFAGIVMLLLGLFFIIFNVIILKKRGLKKNWG